jgi:hypothetical protein
VSLVNAHFGSLIRHVAPARSPTKRDDGDCVDDALAGLGKAAANGHAQEGNDDAAASVGRALGRQHHPGNVD